MEPTRNLWTGRLVRLRGIEPEDWEAFYHLGQDSEVERRDSEIHLPASAASAPTWAEERAAERSRDHDRGFLAIERLEDRAVVGAINVFDADRRHRRLSYGLSVGRQYWRRGYGRETVLLLLGGYFGELGYQRAGAGVYAFNEDSIAFHRALGFVEEGRLRNFVQAAGRRWDSLMFGITAEEFRALHAGFWPRLEGSDGGA